jgi:hypothetical protein
MAQMNTSAPGLSSVQAGVQIVQNMVQCGGCDYASQSEDLFGLMQSFAFEEIRAEYEAHLREADPSYVLTLDEVIAEENDGTPMAQAYWAATSLFFRKVYQAAAAAA